MKKSKLEKAIYYCYKELYNKSTPSVDFDYLLETAKINKYGKKEIDYEKYILDREIYEHIVEDTIKKYKLSSLQRISFKIEMYLGSGPKSVKEFRI